MMISSNASKDSRSALSSLGDDEPQLAGESPSSRRAIAKAIAPVGRQPSREAHIAIIALLITFIGVSFSFRMFLNGVWFMVHVSF